MNKINVFDYLKYTHPNDIILDNERTSIYCINIDENDMCDYNTLRELVEDQGGNWIWYCDYFNLNLNDEKWGKW